MTDDINRVRDVPEGDEFTLVQDQREKRHVLESIGEEYDDWKEGGLFVRTENAEYAEVLWFPGLVPYLSHPITRVHPESDDKQHY